MHDVSHCETPSCSRTAFLCTVLLLAPSTLVNSMTVTSRFVCMGYDSRCVFQKSHLSVKTAKIVNQHSLITVQGSRELRVESRLSDAMAGRSGAAGSAPDVWHQARVVSGISHLFAVNLIRIRHI